ncbi:PAS domain S-box-containing protein [Humidesulfovibrio mexicanus]|uniref:histidine kinase n=1 Tax=Humidesulfovibrio mexicanus TaxID=147047 RepID=A0A239C123_9BACT|nr:ATP-binding protein [Humidesulfovibrio mexicanus]SNS13592.1 PAS domain S-box-containing protein [Humidesulfovibrio mexicanus]
MRVLSKLSFQAKIGLGIFLIVVTVALMTAIPVSRMASRAILAEAKNRGLVLAENLSLRLADAMLTMDLLRMKTMVDELTVVGQDILYAFVQDENGNVLVHTFQKGFPVALARANAAQGDGANITLLDTGQELVYDFAAPVAISGRRFGTARLGLSRSRAEAQVRSLLVTFAGLSAAALAAAILLSTMFARRVTRRLNVLKQYAQEVVRGNLDIETASTLERNCWEIMDCKRQECPAYGKPRHRCWHMQGTLCPDCAPADNNGRKACHRCPVYRENAGDEIQDLAETFGIMAMTLKRQISALARQEQLMRTILDATPDLVCLLDPHGRVLAVNRAFAAFLEKPESEIVGRLEHELFPPEEATVRRERNLAVLASERGEQAETAARTPWGRRWFHQVDVPVRDASGRALGILKTARDVTEVKSIEEKLLQAQKMESLGKLAGGVAHEINTPLGIILGYAQLLQDDVPPEGQLSQDLKIIERQAKVCRKIVADLLGFSRQHESSMGEVDLNASVREVSSLVRHTFSLEKVALELDLADGLPGIVGDKEKLNQVWMNLLNNARDAMPGGGAIRVRTRQRASEGLAEVCVADSGTGISPEHLGKIFDPFFSTKGVGEGTGLGLSVSFGIIQNHGGVIEAESPAPESLRPGAPGAAGPGTVFRVLLPLAAASARKEPPTP